MPITTFEGLKEFITSFPEGNYYFRGYTDIEQLKPTLGREKFADREERAYKAFGEFIKELDKGEINNQTWKDCIALSQHYGVPTKLVDLTVDPWVAVYFGLGKEHKNGRFKILYTDAKKFKATFSNEIRNYNISIGNITEGNTTIDDLLKFSPSIKSLFEFRENDIITPKKTESALLGKMCKKLFDIQEEFVILMYDKTENLRLFRQKGLFVLFRNESDSLKSDGFNGMFQEAKIELSEDEVQKTWNYLEKTCYTEEMLLPEIINNTNVAEIAKKVKKEFFPSN